MRKKKYGVSQARTIAVGFLLIILTATFFLTLPIASADGSWTSPLDALFTAVSATCVTGLVTVDTALHWSFFGKVVIIAAIQIGGLGFMTIGVGFSILLRRRIGLKERGLVQESVSTLKIGGVVKLAKKIIKGTVLFEGIGALILGIRFSFDFGIVKGMWYGIFHSISAFCNAGFDLMGSYSGEYSSLVAYRDDYLVNIVIMSLIVIGGIGFIVWDDISRNKLHFKNYLLHTKMVLVMTAILIFGGCGLYILFENSGILAGLSLPQKINASMFASITTRTAGFNTLDVAQYSQGSKLITVILMFIGGSSGSTAGGIKTTTFFVMIMYLISAIKSNHDCEVFGRRISDDLVRKASLVCTINLFMTLSAALVISYLQTIPIIDIMVEVFSANGTVGMSTGITRELCIASKIVIIILMYGGRIGSLSFALSFREKKKHSRIQLPAESINVG